MGKKGTTKSKKRKRKHGLVHLYFCCIYFSFSICFFVVFFMLFFASNGQVHLFSVLMCFFPIYFASFVFFFFGFEDLLFDFPFVFLLFCCFSSVKNIRTNNRGESRLGSRSPSYGSRMLCKNGLL